MKPRIQIFRPSKGQLGRFKKDEYSAYHIRIQIIHVIRQRDDEKSSHTNGEFLILSSLILGQNCLLKRTKSSTLFSSKSYIYWVREIKFCWFWIEFERIYFLADIHQHAGMCRK